MVEPNRLVNSRWIWLVMLRSRLWVVLFVGVLALVVAFSVRDLIQSMRRADLNLRIAREAEPAVAAYLGDLPILVQAGKYFRPGGTEIRVPKKSFSNEVIEARVEKERLDFMDRYGVFERLSGQGVERPRYAWMLVERLEMRRTAHMSKGNAELMIYIVGPGEHAYFHSDASGGQKATVVIAKASPDSWEVWASHPDFERVPDSINWPLIGIALTVFAGLVAIGRAMARWVRRLI